LNYFLSFSEYGFSGQYIKFSGNKNLKTFKSIGINIDGLVKSHLTCHCEESFGYAQDKLSDEAIY